MVQGIGSIPAALPIGDTGITPKAADGFADAFENAIDGVNDQQLKADHALYAMVTGQNTNLHSTMIALEEANIALRTMASTRDKIVEAYQQIWNMPI